MSKLILYAPNVHIGGGRVLLENLLDVWPENLPFHGFLDSRAVNLPIPVDSCINWVNPTVISRFKSDLCLSRYARPSDVVICFHSLPPLFKCPGKIVVYMQNRNLIEAISFREFAAFTALRLVFERLIGRLFRHRVSEYIVQTPSCKRSLEDWYINLSKDAKPLIRVIPFAQALELTQTPFKDVICRNWDFVYVADGLGQKNHKRLFDAWLHLADEGIFPILALTLGKTETELLLIVDSMKRQGLKVENLGRLTHQEIVGVYQRSGALIYPSIRESFVLPLIEASQLDLPILASELDYVYDVCKPVDTFDPESSRSIARAVKRSLNIDEGLTKLNSPEEFLDFILTRINKELVE